MAGIEHQMAHGIVLSARYSDRRLLRIVEDMQGVSPEGANAGLPNQIYLIGNPSPSADYFVNEQEEQYTGTTPPANCVLDYGPQEDSLGPILVQPAAVLTLLASPLPTASRTVCHSGSSLSGVGN